MSSSPSAPKLHSSTMLSIFERMMKVRRFEEALLEFVARGERIGPHFVHIGQEATCASVMEVAGPDDFFVTHHRNHGHLIARGSDPGRTYAELLGRRDGLLGGRGGGFHTADHSLGFLQSSAIVGGSISLLVGAGFAAQRLGGGRVAIGFFGDSALEEGVAYEALNAAALWKLPAIFICENNTPGAAGSAHGGMPVLVHSAQRLTAIPEAMGMTTRLAHGSDAGAVHAAALEARELCLQGRGPVFIETPNERWTGSQTIIPQFLGATDMAVLFGDAEPSGKDADWASRSDPILHWTRRILAEAVASREELVKIDETIRADMATGLEMAVASPRPDPATALERVFA